MTNAVQVLERMGGSAEMTAHGLAAFFAGLDVSEAEREAIARGDAGTLGELTGARARMMCVIYAPDSEPLKKEDDDHEGDQDERDDEQEE